MKWLLKILAMPMVAALTLVVALAGFVLSLSGIVLGIIAGIVALLALHSLFTGDVTNGLVCLSLAFAVSPFGLPALARWLVDRLDDANFALKVFIKG